MIMAILRSMRVIESELPIFPCDWQKAPLTPNGFYDASVIGSMPEHWPLVGVPTGAASGIDVLDIDPNGALWYVMNFDAIPLTRRHITKRGVHLLFQHAEGLGCSKDGIAPGVDVKADGGYVCWWPRQGLPVEDRPLSQWPALLLAMARQSKGEHVSEREHTRRPLYRAVLLERWLSEAPAGTKNDRLFFVACRYAEMINEGVLHPSLAQSLLANGARRWRRRWLRLKARDWQWPKKERSGS
jgi:hypothetical protein